MEGVADTHGIRPRRKEDIVDWPVRVLYKLAYYNHGLLTYAGVVTSYHSILTLTLSTTCAYILEI